MGPVTHALPAGSNTIGKVIIDATEGGNTVDVTKVAGAAVAQGHGTAAAAVRVELPTDGTGKVGLNAGSAIVGSFSIDQTTDGTTNKVNTELPTPAALTDGTANPTAPAVGACPHLFDGTDWDRQRGNQEFEVLASAARTVAASSAGLTNHNSRGVMIVLDVTAASGTGGLQVRICGRINGQDAYLNAAPTAIVSTGRYFYELYPGSSTAGTGGSNNINQRTSGVLPRTWVLTVDVGDASSYTYSVSASLIL